MDKEEIIEKIKVHGLNPTHSCFYDCMYYLDLLCAQNMDKFRQQANRYRLVHGILSTKNGDISHAWIEIDNINILESRMMGEEKVFCGFKLKEFYRELNVKYIKKYKLKEAAKLNMKYGYTGPWEQRFLKLCRDYKGDKDA